MLVRFSSSSCHRSVHDKLQMMVWQHLFAMSMNACSRPTARGTLRNKCRQRKWSTRKCRQRNCKWSTKKRRQRNGKWSTRKWGRAKLFILDIQAVDPKARTLLLFIFVWLKMSNETSNLHVVQFFNAQLLAHLDFWELRYWHFDVSRHNVRWGASSIFIAILNKHPEFQNFI